MSLKAQSARRIMGALPILLLSALLLLALPNNAHAEEGSPYEGQVLTGTCHIGDYWSVGNDSYFHCSWNDGQFSGTWTMHCLNLTAAEPPEQWAPYTATVTNYDPRTGMTTYSIVITPQRATDGVTYQGGLLTGYQRVGGEITVQRTPVTGSLSIHKFVAPVEGEVSEVNLEGIIFKIIDPGTGECIGTLELDANGQGYAEGIPIGNYLLEEVEESMPENLQIYTHYYDMRGCIEGITFSISDEWRNADLTIENHLKRHLEVEKVDAEDGSPIPDTLISLQRWQDGDWREVAQATTDGQGVADFGYLPYGDYRLVELRPNPHYQEPEESQIEPVYFCIDTSSPKNIYQVMENDAINLACSLDKETIALTSAGFQTRKDDKALSVDNVGTERYYYRLSYRSDSNVRADEFTVIDDLVAAQEHKVVIDRLWIPIAQGDTDGFLNIWFKTNRTDEGTCYSTANASASNPPNPNTTQGMRVTDTTGWRLLASKVPADSRMSWTQDDFGLEEGEYITSMMYEYGSVEVGFATIAPVTYSVTCPGALGVGTVLDNRARCAIYRNTQFNEDGSYTLTLHDEDQDLTQTRVIDTFMTSAARWEGNGSSGQWIEGGLADTGDQVPWIPIAALAVGLGLIILAFFCHQGRTR